jgi:serine/threonine protein kinase
LLPPGTRIGNRYQVERMFGQGGMSNLYLARDLSQGGAIRVIKEMTARYNDPNEQRMAEELFMREAQLLATLSHPNIPKVFDKFTFQGKYYLSMEYVQGEDLGKILANRNGPMPEKDVASWGAQMATVLYYLHRQNPPIVFRDVKPSNMMISGSQVKLIDFGIARTFTSAKKGDTMRIGSPGYAPPEQYSGQTDPRSDIYALGVTLHHAITGRDPTASQTPFLLPPARTINSSVSPEMAAIIERSTQLEPEKRYPSMIEMKRDLQVVLRSHGVNVGSASMPLSAMPVAGVASVPLNPATPIQTTVPPVVVPIKNPVPVSTVPSRRRSPWLAASVLGFLAVAPVVVHFFPNLIGDSGARLAELTHMVFSSPIPSDPGLAGVSLYQRGGPLGSCFQLLESARQTQGRDPSVDIAWNNVVVEQSGGPALHLAVLVPEGAVGTEDLTGLVRGQSWLNSLGGQDKSRLILDVGRYAPKGLSSEWDQAASGQLARRQLKPVPPTALLAFGAPGLKLPSKPDSVPAFTVDFESGASGKTLALPALRPDVHALVGGRDFLWNGSEPAPAGAHAVASASEVGGAARKLSSPTLILQTSKPDVLKDYAGLHLRTVVLWERLDRLPDAPARGSIGNTTLVTPASRFSSQASQSGYFQFPAAQDSPGLQAGRAYDALFWTLSQGHDSFSGVTLRSDKDGHVSMPRWSVYTAGSEGWIFSREVEANP